MQHVQNAEDWKTWIDENQDLDEPTKLDALREYIFQTAEEQVAAGEIKADWANKKLAALGVPDRISREHRYTLRVPVTGLIDLDVYAVNRPEALAKLAQRLDGTGSAHVATVPRSGDPAFVAGPEDVPADAMQDAPTTIDGTLVKLRETLMLAVIAGPRITCTSGMNRILASFGLAELPARQTFTVRRPVEGFVETTVEAYDAESAHRVAGWRWADGRKGYSIGDVQDKTDQASVAVVSE